MIRNIKHKNEVNIYMMFYPVSWRRDRFECCDEKQVLATIEYFRKDAITFCKWGEMDVDDDGECRSADIDQEFFNDWDDEPIFADGYPEEEKKIKESALKTIGKDEAFVKSHWCLAVTEALKNKIEKL